MNEPERKWRKVASALCLIALLPALCLAVENRFPRPDFASGYESPATEVPPVQPDVYGLIDVLLLGLAMLLASMLVLRQRRRSGIVVLTVGSLIYFGFWRNGCVCPVGSIRMS